MFVKVIFGLEEKKQSGKKQNKDNLKKKEIEYK